MTRKFMAARPPPKTGTQRITALNEEGVGIVVLWQHDAASSDALSVKTMGQ